MQFCRSHCFQLWTFFRHPPPFKPTPVPAKWNTFNTFAVSSTSIKRTPVVSTIGHKLKGKLKLSRPFPSQSWCAQAVSLLTTVLAGTTVLVPLRRIYSYLVHISALYQSRSWCTAAMYRHQPILLGTVQSISRYRVAAIAVYVLCVRVGDRSS